MKPLGGEVGQTSASASPSWQVWTCALAGEAGVRRRRLHGQAIEHGRPATRCLLAFRLSGGRQSTPASRRPHGHPVLLPVLRTTPVTAACRIAAISDQSRRRSAISGRHQRAQRATCADIRHLVEPGALPVHLAMHKRQVSKRIKPL